MFFCKCGALAYIYKNGFEIKNPTNVSYDANNEIGYIYGEGNEEYVTFESYSCEACKVKTGAETKTVQ